MNKMNGLFAIVLLASVGMSLGMDLPSPRAAFMSSRVINDKVIIHVYYESQCPDSRRFIIQQMPRALDTFPNLVEFVLVPFGKANVSCYLYLFNFNFWLLIYFLSFY